MGTNKNLYKKRIKKCVFNHENETMIKTKMNFIPMCMKKIGKKE